MHFGLLLALTARENVWEQIEPFRGETNKLDGARIITVWRTEHRSEWHEIREQRRRARKEWYSYAREEGMFADVISIAEPGDRPRLREQLREAIEARSDDTLQRYLRRRGFPVPYAFLAEGRWLERDYPNEESDTWAERYLLEYVLVPPRTLCVWLDCHR